MKLDRRIMKKMTPSISEGVKHARYKNHCIILCRENDLCTLKMNVMLSAKEVSIVYETLLSSPGMNDTVKIDLRLPRKNVLLLTKVIELGLSVKGEDAGGGWLHSAGKEVLEQLGGINTDLLQKAGLTEVYTKLNTLQAK